MLSRDTIITVEDRLKTCMIESDVSVLGELLSDELIFTDHLGQIMTKQDDLNAHQSGSVNIETIDQSEQLIQIHGDIAIVSVASRIKGKFGDTYSEMSLRFTRIWQARHEGHWKVIAAHSTLMDKR